MITCVGTAPLLMHSGRLIDPLDTVSKKIKEVSGKRTKTDTDHADMAQLEWLGGLYYLAGTGPFVPAVNLQKCLVEAARLKRAGKKVERGVFIETFVIPLQYDGPREPDELYKDKRFVHRAPVKVPTGRIMRTRPQFPEWSLEAFGQFDPAVLNMDDLRQAADQAGAMIGLGDFRPAHGRFTCTVEEAQ
jgi:hypothetical protein